MAPHVCGARLRLCTSVAMVAAALAACRQQDAQAEPQAVSPGVVERWLTPAPTPLAPGVLIEAERLVRAQIADDAFPGAALAIGNRAVIQTVVGIGRTRWDDDAPAVSADSTLYDLASLTKVVAATAAVMALVEDGRLALDAPVRQYLPEFSGGDKDQVTIRQLLTHTSGVRAGVVEVQGDTPGEVRRLLLAMSLALVPGQDVLYSDLGFVVLWAAAERAAGEPLGRYLRRKVWGPLGMTSTGVGVPSPCARCAPTQHLEERDEPYTGGSYDELARRMDGLAGNAGAFSTARDMGRFAAMIANEGRLGDIRVFRTRTVRAFVQPQPDAGTRALGWEVYCREGMVSDQEPCKQVYAFGHTGVTGTSLWIDPVTRTWVVLLTNRSYLPREKGDMQKFRRKLYDAVTQTGANVPFAP